MNEKLLLYDTFNAKYLSFQEVAESFVSNDEFFQLTRNDNMLLMGSRGCGKTTLMKMLTPAALSFWQGSEADRFRHNIEFTAVYIPSDIQWKNQFEYLSNNIRGKEGFVEVVTYFLFSSNIQIALCKAFNSVIAFGDYDSNQKLILEFQVCKSLIEKWEFEKSISPTFDDLELYLLGRVREVNSLLKQRIFKSDFQEIESTIPSYVFDNFFDLIKLGCKVFEKEVKLDDTHKWALCFDELEIVPKFIQLELIKYLRSVDQKYLFKLTTTPLFKLENENLVATQGNDFGAIKLWVYDEAGLRRWREFCAKLLLNRFAKNYPDIKVNLQSVFGSYTLDDVIKDELNELTSKEKEKLGYKGSFKPGSGSKESSLNFMFKRLAQVDPSFAEFLTLRNVDSKDPYTDDKLTQKSVFLKYKVDAVYRLIYKGRTRKTPAIHYGLPYIFDLCDGNPRLVIGLIDEILSKSNVDFEKPETISKSEQSRIIYSASDKYYNLIRNHPDSTILKGGAEINLADNLLMKVGNYILDKTVKDNFSKNCPSTFRVDEGVNSSYLEMLETALALGAIIYLDPIESVSNNGLIGKRFRLSGFLTPKFKIPSRIKSEVRLSTVLKIEDNKQQQQIDYSS